MSELKWITFTGGNTGYTFELAFDDDKTHEIAINKGMNKKQVYDELLRAASELFELNEE